MKGIIFNLVEEIVGKELGEDTWDTLLDDAGLDGAYTSIGTYPDEELYAIVEAASKRLSLPAEQVILFVATRAAQMFAERFPGFYAPHATTRSLLAALDSIIHPEVKKLYPNAETPSFGLESRADGRLALHYRSRRQLCRFAEGLVMGTAPVFGEQARVEHKACTSLGDDHCVLVIDLQRTAA